MPSSSPPLEATTTVAVVSSPTIPEVSILPTESDDQEVTPSTPKRSKKETEWTTPPVPCRSLDTSPPNSLNRLLARRSPVPSSSSSEIDLYGYGDYPEQPKTSTTTTAQPPKRRFQRRNSKTPAMLLLANPFFQEQIQEAARMPDLSHNMDDCLQLAEQIVKSVQKRRRSNA